MLYGAILGDIIGSRFEFDRGGKTKEFKLFEMDSQFTDDTVMSVAVADGLIRSGYNADEKTIKKNLIDAMKFWGRHYPYAGYGSSFRMWLKEEDPKPYGSWGNGSAMRVSPVGYLYDTLERTLEVAKWSAEISHNHPEGIKGAQCTAGVIFMARIGRGKTEIRQFVKDMFGYNIDTTVDELRKKHRHDESCMDSLPKALVAFFEGEDYEDTVRNAVSLGGDTDTIAAIAGSMAEAYWGVPEDLRLECRKRVNRYIKEVLDSFEKLMSQDKLLMHDPEDRRNLGVEYCARKTREAEYEHDAVVRLLDELLLRVSDNGTVTTPVLDVNNTMEEVDFFNMEKGDTFSFDKELRLRVDTLKDSNDKLFIPLYTRVSEIDYSKTAHVTINWPIRALIEDAYNREDVQALVINPFSTSIVLSKPVLKILIDQFD